MRTKSFLRLVGVIFSLITVIHLWRFIARWDVALDLWFIPLWASLIGVFVGAYLAYESFRLSKK